MCPFNTGDLLTEVTAWAGLTVHVDLIQDTIYRWQMVVIHHSTCNKCGLIYMYNQTCLMWPSKGTLKKGHIRQVVT